VTDTLTNAFEDSRAHLQAVAYRMLGSTAEAEDAVQEAWLRLSRSDTSDVANLRGWLTTVVARICLDHLRARKAEEPLDMEAVDADVDPEREAVLADTISAALLVILETLTPSERVAFVLHDMFDLPFEEIAPIVGRSAPAARQLASRARRRVQGKADDSRSLISGQAGLPVLHRKREIVDAFLAAARGGDFEGLLALLDPKIVFHGAPQGEIRGAEAVAKFFAGRAKAAQPADIDGTPALLWAPGGTARVLFKFTFDGDRIAAIDLVTDPALLQRASIRS